MSNADSRRSFRTVASHNEEHRCRAATWPLSTPPHLFTAEPGGLPRPPPSPVAIAKSARSSTMPRQLESTSLSTHATAPQFELDYSCPARCRKVMEETNVSMECRQGTIWNASNGDYNDGNNRSDGDRADTVPKCKDNRVVVHLTPVRHHERPAYPIEKNWTDEP